MPNNFLVVDVWPEAPTAEAEIFHRLQLLPGCKVVDRYGYDPSTGIRVNFSDFSFALYLHYEPYPVLPIKSYLALINPLDFYMYRDPSDTRICMQNYDAFIPNGSSMLVEWIKYLGPFGSKILADLIFLPTVHSSQIANVSINEWSARSSSFFYCGINWDFKKRAPSYMIGSFSESSESSEILNASTPALNVSRLSALSHLDPALVDIYGPKTMLGAPSWIGYSNYIDEIPFDGSTLITTMSRYKYVLCINSDHHNKWKTSSSRSFEAIAAGCMPICSDNEHIRSIFGDLIFYYNPSNVKVEIQAIISECEADPDSIVLRIQESQKILKKYTLDSLINNLFSSEEGNKQQIQVATGRVSEAIKVELLMPNDLSTSSFRDNALYMLSYDCHLADSCLRSLYQAEVGCSANSLPRAGALSVAYFNDKPFTYDDHKHILSAASFNKSLPIASHGFPDRLPSLDFSIVPTRSNTYNANPRLLYVSRDITLYSPSIHPVSSEHFASNSVCSEQWILTAEFIHKHKNIITLIRVSLPYLIARLVQAESYLCNDIQPAHYAGRFTLVRLLSELKDANRRFNTEIRYERLLIEEYIDKLLRNAA